MKTLSIRGVSEDLAALIKSAAQKEEKRVNAFVLDALRRRKGKAFFAEMARFGQSIRQVV